VITLGQALLHLPACSKAYPSLQTAHLVLEPWAQVAQEAAVHAAAAPTPGAAAMAASRAATVIKRHVIIIPATSVTYHRRETAGAPRQAHRPRL